MWTAKLVSGLQRISAQLLFDLGRVQAEGVLYCGLSRLWGPPSGAGGNGGVEWGTLVSSLASVADPPPGTST